jgi:chromosome segregation ATPase
MTDEELIAFLRGKGFSFMEKAADRIEELTKLLATTKDTLNICRAANADMAESVEGFFQERDELLEQLEAARADAKEAEAYAEELEAKLAKAVDWFETIRDRAKGDYMAHTYYLDALAALATIKRREP